MRTGPGSGFASAGGIHSGPAADGPGGCPTPPTPHPHLDGSGQLRRTCRSCCAPSARDALSSPASPKHCRKPPPVSASRPSCTTARKPGAAV